MIGIFQTGISSVLWGTQRPQRMCRYALATRTDGGRDLLNPTDPPATIYYKLMLMLCIQTLFIQNFIFNFSGDFKVSKDVKLSERN